MFSWAVVVPTNRPEQFAEFYKAWEPLFKLHNVHLVIVEDAEKKSKLDIQIPHTHLCWKDKPEFIPKQTDMIRSLGFHHVYKNKLADYTLTLDDDVRPVEDIFNPYQMAFSMGAPLSTYFSVGRLTTSALEMRGFPFKDRNRVPVGVQYGGWHGVLDYDAITQLAIPQPDHSFKRVTIPVPKGAPVTCCIMNCAFRTELTPIMWQLPLFEGRYNRYGDIWSGLFIKKTLDAIGEVMLINGDASILHQRASDPYKNLEREAPGVWLNDHLWENLATPKSTDMVTAYKNVIDSAYKFFAEHDKPYADHFAKSSVKWLELFE